MQAKDSSKSSYSRIAIYS